MTRDQFRALASGLIELGNVVLAASVVSAIFDRNPWPQGYWYTIIVGAGGLLGLAAYLTALKIIGETAGETVEG